MRQRLLSKVARLQLRVRELATEGTPHAQLVVDALGVLVSANTVARRMLDISSGDLGRPLKDLEVSHAPIDLRSPIDRAYRRRRSVSIPSVEFSSGGRSRFFDLFVAPLIDGDGSIIGASVSFVDVSEVAQLRSDLERSRQDVETAYAELQSSNEELETTNQQLQSTVEELETTNEELQSSNEELETMNAELQSINTDLRVRSDGVGRLNTFLRAISGNIELGAAAIDADSRVQVWNERAADLWGLRSHEVVGRSLFDLDIGLPLKKIRQMVRTVLRGEPLHGATVLKATTRRGLPIRCRLMVHALADGDRPTGAVVVMEELRAEKPPSR